MMKNEKEILINLCKEMTILCEKMSALQVKLFDFLSNSVLEDKEIVKAKPMGVTDIIQSVGKKNRKKSSNQNWRLRPTALEIKNHLIEKNSSASGKEILEMMHSKHNHEWDDVKKALSGIKLSVRTNPIFVKTREGGSFEESLFGLTEWDQQENVNDKNEMDEGGNYVITPFKF